MKRLLVCLLFTVSQLSFAHDLSLKYSSKVTSEHKVILESAMEEIASLLPAKMKAQLPREIEVNVVNVGKINSIPKELCSTKTKEEISNEEDKTVHGKKRFIYGSYDQYKNILIINAPVLNELKKGRANSKRISCQHKSLYDQAIATIIHELTHAYDFENGQISNSMEYIRRAGFKKGLLKIKNKNISAMRSADPYELVSISESFAVNMEYFTMDPEFMCRKPSMFDYFKRQFGVDPFPNRNCTVNNTIMMSTSVGFLPVELDLSRVYRIDYLQASAGKELMSGFGHSMFRVIMCAPEHFDSITKRVIPATPFGKKCLEDKFYHLIISYRANVQDAKLSYLKGVFGGYPSLLFILSFTDVLDEYNRDELRDIVSYPLKFSEKEREDFINRVKEEHWNYRGAYKFINNNCATESYDLLKNALVREELNKKSSVSPNGVLEDLDKMQFLSTKDSDVEVFKAQTEQIILAYTSVYGYKLKNEKADKDAVAKFIETSTITDRMKRFQDFKKTNIPESELNAELSLLKERLVQASSFSVMEQQILRVYALKLKKQVAELLMKTEDQGVQELIKVARKTFGKSINELSNAGYGIPFESEMLTKEELVLSAKESKVVMDEVDKTLRLMLSQEFALLDQFEKNIKAYNLYSLEVRKNYRAKLEHYIRQVLKNLSHGDFTRSILLEARDGNKESLVKVRELLGKKLVTENEILNNKLRKIIDEII